MKSAPVFRLLLTGLTRENVVDIACPPALQTLLRTATPVPPEPGGFEHWLCTTFGAGSQQPLPAAPYAASGAGLPAERGYWLYASPVQLQLQRDSFAMEGVAQGLSQSQAEALVAALNAHFSVDGLTFYAPRADVWFVQLDRTPDLSTTPLSDVLGRNIHPRLPTGGEALLWHRRLNEIQMLLHQHPVNVAREQAGLPTVNSLWFWGGGQYQALPVHPVLKVWSDDPLALGLARAAGAVAMGLPTSMQTLLAQPLSEAGLLILPVFAPQSSLDACAARWAEIDREWLSLLLEALQRGSLARLELLLAGPTAVHGYALSRTSLFKFWRRSRPLETYLG